MQRKIIQIIITVVVISPVLRFAFPNNSEVTSKVVTYHNVDDKGIEGFLARPAAPGEYPAIIMIHEWWGLTKDIKNIALDFAQQGYVTLAVDLYNGVNTNDRQQAGKLAGEVRKNMDAAFANLKSAISFLKDEPSVDKDRLASIGWCFGGGWSYQIAKNNLGVKASVIYYGRFNLEDDLQKMQAEIIGHFADKDGRIKIDTVKEFQAKLKTTNGIHEIYIYPNTTHGFASRPGTNPSYNKEAADLAWQRTLVFLNKHL